MPKLSNNLYPDQLSKSGLNNSVAHISHELRTPLTVIQGALGLLESGKLGDLSDHGKHLIQLASRNTDRLLRLVKVIEQQVGCQPDVMSALDLTQLRLELDLKTALRKDEFYLVYQPILNLSTGQLTGFEALLRWQHPTLGTILPSEFIPLAEAIDIIVEMGIWVVREACAQLQSWHEQFGELPGLTMSINLSGKQLSSQMFCQQIQSILATTNLSPTCLKLEITESAVIDDFEIASQTLKQLKTWGIQLCIDDFGTGYSCLNRLYELPLDVLKIDRSFVQQIGSERGEQLIRAIVSLANNLGVEVIAEGVETQDQINKLSGFGCQLAQGYYFAQPFESKLATNFIHQIIFA